ncbi:alpha/beta hydrolase domain-containing protein [Roseomonas sp. GCM10028921]
MSVSAAAQSRDAARNSIPTPSVIGPVPSGNAEDGSNNRTFFATDIALGSYGYAEEEFYLEGRANTYDAPIPTPPTPPTALANVMATEVPYRTRMVVRRPSDPARFNGTVVVEWLNVTDGFDGEYFWVQSHQYLVRAGYAYIGLSAQDNGISNPNTGLKAFSVARYGALDVTGRGGECCTADRLSYDIFSQAAKAAYAVPSVLNGLTPRNAIGVGMSQSGSRLGIYANYIHMRAPIYDALLIQVSNPVLRDDVPTPIIKVLSETETREPSFSLAQPDTATRRSYWVAGSSHGDTIQRTGRNGVRLRDLGLAKTPNDACGPDGTTPTRSRVPLRHVLNAALHHLKAQVEHDAVPPSGPALRRSAEGQVQRDNSGNVVGGVRLADMEVPTARANGVECGNIGAWVPFGTAQLQSLYPTHEDYVGKVRAAVAASVAAGFVLPQDAAETVAEAEASMIGTGQECGPACLNSSHYRPDLSSTGLLRETTVYYNIRNGQPLIDAADRAHRLAAAGDSATGDAAAQSRAGATEELRRYVAALGTAQSEGNVTPSAARVLRMQADAVARSLTQ